jgi:hypothetical protein
MKLVIRILIDLFRGPFKIIGYGWYKGHVVEILLPVDRPKDWGDND